MRQFVITLKFDADSDTENANKVLADFLDGNFTVADLQTLGESVHFEAKIEELS